MNGLGNAFNPMRLNTSYSDELSSNKMASEPHFIQFEEYRDLNPSIEHHENYQIPYQQLYNISDQREDQSDGENEAEDSEEKQEFLMKINSQMHRIIELEEQLYLYKTSTDTLLKENQVLQSQITELQATASQHNNTIQALTTNYISLKDLYVAEHHKNQKLCRINHILESQIQETNFKSIALEKQLQKYICHSYYENINRLKENINFKNIQPKTQNLKRNLPKQETFVDEKQIEKKIAPFQNQEKYRNAPKIKSYRSYSTLSNENKHLGRRW